ncbi:hypothetical protein B0H66DRAFT_643666 [Apodospora peruviana]|uniref:Uncharacterized protein n=1 Tax=Apodospora peruviana TaxID=516989 RepID=A0AAE0M146_9PEZI|nr:hypothetical protein B0H66DRAFT_643666 [Apodospora peruviana]
MANDADFKNLNITSLNDLRISYLTDFILARGTNLTQNHGIPCEAASNLLPLTNLSSLSIRAPDPKIANSNLTVNADPALLDVGIVNLQRFASQVFPYPVSGSSIGDVASWWAASAANDRENTTDFLSAVVNTCASTYCRRGHITIGNPDIVGIGMLTAVSMLLFLAIAFSILSFGPVVDIVSRPSPKKHFSFRQSCIGTVDELFSAVYVFGISVLVSTFAFRYRTDARFDVLMADGLSLCCSTTVIMLAATYWAHNKQRPHATASFIVTAIITIALFGTHFNVASKRASPVELACGTGKGWITVTQGDPFDMRLFRFIPVGFACWCMALIGAVFHHPIMHKRRPAAQRKWALGFWKVAESLPSVFGCISLAIYAAYFFNTWHMMKETYGEAFTSAEKTWGFGQYLAVFTWLPPILTFAHLFFSGMKGMLETRLPKGWRVEHDDEGHDAPAVKMMTIGNGSQPQWDKGFAKPDERKTFVTAVEEMNGPVTPPLAAESPRYRRGGTLGYGQPGIN